MKLHNVMRKIIVIPNRYGQVRRDPRQHQGSRPLPRRLLRQLRQSLPHHTCLGMIDGLLGSRGFDVNMKSSRVCLIRTNQ